MDEIVSLRYKIDFVAVPAFFYQKNDRFRRQLFLFPAETLASVYTAGYRTLSAKHPNQEPMRFSISDFLVQRRVLGEESQLIYVSTPKPPRDDSSSKYCEAFVLVERPDGLGLYMVEQTIEGSGRFSMVDENGIHRILDEMGGSMKENINRLLDRFFPGAGETTEELSETRQPGGGKVAVTMNMRDNCGQIREYDNQGNLMNITHGTFRDSLAGAGKTPKSPADPPTAPHPQETSPKPGTPKAWLAQGIADFERGAYDTALEAFRQAGDAGNSEAQNWTGVLHYAGLGTRQDPHLALAWFKKAANQGHGDAMRNLAILYDKGEGTLRNPMQARKWYEKALSVAPGDAVAMNNLGRLCLTRDRSRAEQLIRKAAELGCPAAAENLTVMDKDPTALKMADLPTDRGTPPAKPPLTVQSIAAYHGTDETPNGGAYTILSQCGRYVTFTEYDENHNEIFRTTGTVGEPDEEPEWEMDEKMDEDPVELSPEERKRVMAELRRTIASCSCAPLSTDLDDRARWLMGRVESFRKKGVPEEELSILKFRILQFMPDFAGRNFEEFFAFLREDITPIRDAMAYHRNHGDLRAAKVIAAPLAQYLEKNKAVLLDGHRCFQNAFEATMHSIESGDNPSLPDTRDNYTAFLTAYAKILLEAKPSDHALCQKYLEWALEISPENAEAWLYLAETEDGQMQLDLCQKALHYCYRKDGPGGLTAIYEQMAQCYQKKRKPETAAALREFLSVLNGKTEPGGKRSCQAALEKRGIQAGFGRLAFFTAMLFRDPSMQEQMNDEIRQIVDTILTSPVQKSPLFGI